MLSNNPVSHKHQRLLFGLVLIVILLIALVVVFRFLYKLEKQWFSYGSSSLKLTNQQQVFKQVLEQVLVVNPSPV